MMESNICKALEYSERVPVQNSWTFFFLIYLFYFYLFLAALGLCCCRQASSSCGERGLLFIVVASLVVEHGLQSAGSVVVAHGLSCSAACGTFLDQGSNLCLLHWQADS